MFGLWTSLGGCSVILILQISVIRVQSSGGCPVPSVPPDRRIFLSSMSVKALVSELSPESLQLWILQVYKGEDKLASFLGLNEESGGLPNLRDRRLNITGLNNCSHLQKVLDKTSSKAFIVLLKEKQKSIFLDSGSGSIIPFTNQLENRVFKLLGWDSWSQWSSCSQSCGGGSQSRQRRCRKDICPGFDIERRVCNTFSCKGSINLLEVERESYFKPSRMSFHRIPGRQQGFSFKSGSYVLYPFPTHISFPRQFTMFITFRPYKDSEGTLLSLTNPKKKADFLSLDLTRIKGRDEVGLKLVYSTTNGSRVVAVPAKSKLYMWNQLTISIGDESTIKTYQDCRWVTTQILHGHQFVVTDKPDVAIGYMYQGDIEQLTVSPNPEDVSEQCSLSKLPLSSERRNLQETRYLEEKHKKTHQTTKASITTELNKMPPPPHQIMSNEIDAPLKAGAHGSEAVGEDYLDEEFIVLNKRDRTREGGLTYGKVKTRRPEAAGEQRGHHHHGWVEVKEDEEEGSGGDLDEVEGSGEDDDSDLDDDNAPFDLDWSSWSPCSATCGPAVQTRWSRCADNAQMMECIDSGMEKKVTRGCNLPPCREEKPMKEHNKTGKDNKLRKLKNLSTHHKIGKQGMKEKTGLEGNGWVKTADQGEMLNRTRARNGDSAAIAAKVRNSKQKEDVGNICGCTENGHCDITTHRCWCEPGWSGVDCGDPICEPPCDTGAECVKPNVCGCKIGFSGKNCQKALCEPACENGGVCVSPFKCRCPSGFKGKFCQKSECKQVCKNGGTCLGDNKCLCPHGYSGLDCGDFTCNHLCQNGGICNTNNTCTCPLGFGGNYCEQRTCKEFEKVRVPRRWAYKTVANIHRSSDLNQPLEQPVYRTFYRTTYKTVLRCKEEVN